MKLFLTLVCFLPFLNSIAQDSNVVKERAAFKLRIEVDKNSVYESDIPASPYLNGPNVLQLYPGEKVFIEVEQTEGTISSLKVVRENKHPEKTLEISFAQNAEKRKHQNMMLSIKNPFEKDLTYSAIINLMPSKKWVNTNVLPVQAGLSGFEMWPDLIISIGLAEWAFKK